MNDCQLFKRWLIENNGCNVPETDAAIRHMQQCRSCLRIYEADQALEKIVKNEMQSVDPPPGLIANARRAAENRSARPLRWDRKYLWKMVTPAVAALAVVLLIVLHPFSVARHSLDELVDHSVRTHFAAQAALDFEDIGAAHAAGWFSDRLEFPVNTLDLKKLGLTLVGGRICKFDTIRVGHIHCDANGKPASLFLINPDDVRIPSDNRKYVIEENNYKVKIWQESGVICALVI